MFTFFPKVKADARSYTHKIIAKSANFPLNKAESSFIALGTTECPLDSYTDNTSSWPNFKVQPELEKYVITDPE